jgi:hypothetical protein
MRVVIEYGRRFGPSLSYQERDENLVNDSRETPL